MMMIFLQMTATIHTKQALSTVLGMFNQTLDLQSEFGWKANDSVERMETEPAPGKTVCCLPSPDKYMLMCDKKLHDFFNYVPTKKCFLRNKCQTG